MKQRAVGVIRGYKDLNFIALAMQGKKIGLEKVVTMIDEMVALLKAEQADDDDKKEYCSVQADSLDDKKKGLERTISNGEKTIAEAKESLKTLASEILALEKGVKALDKNVADAT